MPTVKFRATLLDIAQLERVNDDGLEQWRPLLMELLPLTMATVASVWRGQAKVRA